MQRFRARYQGGLPGSDGRSVRLYLARRPGVGNHLPVFISFDAALSDA